MTISVLILGIERSAWVSRNLLALQDTTAEIRVRGAVALLMVLAALATAFGLDAILGAFLAGATLKLLDRDQSMTHTLFHLKLQAVGFGAFVPFVFVSTGMALDVRSLVDDPTTLAKVPVFVGRWSSSALFPHSAMHRWRDAVPSCWRPGSCKRRR